MFGKCTPSIFVDVPYWPPYSMDKFISCVVPGPLQWILLWRIGRNCMDSFCVSTVDVPESPIASSARGLGQQRDATPCIVMKNDGVLCHSFLLSIGWRWCCRTCNSRQHLQSAFEVQHDAVLPDQCNIPQWTSLPQPIVEGTFSLDEENWNASIHLIGVLSLVHMSEPRFRPRKLSSSLWYQSNKACPTA